MSADQSLLARLRVRDQSLALALVFGVVSVPWTYVFVVTGVPLWPSFIASATFFAAGGSVTGLQRTAASNVAGIAYGAATLALVGAHFGGDVIALSLTVGGFMLLASLHEYLPLVSFTPGGFLGFATLFSVHAAGVTALGFDGLAGETIAALGSMFIGALIGYGAEWLSRQLS
jgi:hypothetical protein